MAFHFAATVKMSSATSLIGVHRNRSPEDRDRPENWNFGAPAVMAKRQLSQMPWSVPS